MPLSWAIADLVKFGLCFLAASETSQLGVATWAVAIGMDMGGHGQGCQSLLDELPRLGLR